MWKQSLICNKLTIEIIDNLKRFIGKTVRVHGVVGIVEDFVIDFITPSFGNSLRHPRTIESVKVIIATGDGEIIKYINSISDLEPVPDEMEGDKSMGFMDKAKKLVVDYYNDRVDKTDGVKLTENDVYIVWFSKTLQNWKALLSTSVSDGMYYEVTYNGDKKEAYLDAYKKWENKCIPDE